MKIIFLALSLFVSVLVLKAQTAIPVSISKNGHILVKAKINNVEGSFILDTGAGLHVMSNRFYQKVKHQVLDSGRFTAFRHTGERLDLKTYQFEQVSLNPMSQSNAWVGVYPGFDEMGFDGLISCKLFENDLLTIDVKNSQLIVESRQSLPKKIQHTLPLILHDNRGLALDIFIEMVVDSTHRAVMEFDTGAGYSPVNLHSRYIALANADTTAMEIRMSQTGFGTTVKTYFDKTKKVHTQVQGATEGGYPNIMFKPSLIYDGAISHVIFGDTPWTLDIANRKLYLLK